MTSPRKARPLGVAVLWMGRSLLSAAAMVPMWGTLPAAAAAASGGGHVHTDSFPTHDEYDVMALDPATAHGAPYGGYSRATASRLAALPLRLPDTGADLPDYEPAYMTVRDSRGRPYACRVYHEDELEATSLTDSLFDVPRLAGPAAGVARTAKATDKKGDNDEEGVEAKAGPAADGAANDGGAGEGASDGAASNPSVGAATVGAHDGVIPTEADAGATPSGEVVPSSASSPASASDQGQHWRDDPILVLDEITRRLSKLVGLCGQLHPNWWSYEWCHEEKVTQFHVQIGTSTDADVASGNQQVQQILLEDITSLGTYSQRTVLTSFDLMAEGEGAGPAEEDGAKKKGKAGDLNFAEGRTELGRVVDTFIDGDLCPETNTPRQTEVTLRCCSDRIMAKTKGGVLKNGRLVATDLLTIARATEAKDAVCQYSITVCTPLLCDDVDDASFDGETGSLGAPTATGAAASTSGTSDRVLGQKKATRFDLDPAEVEKLSVMEVLEASFGKGGTFCFQAGSGGWWIYEFCPGDYIRQYHETTVMDRITGQASSTLDTDHILGRYIAADHASVAKDDEWRYVVNATDSSFGSSYGGKNKNSRQAKTRAPSVASLGGNGAYYHQEYTRGDLCDHEDVTDSAIKAGAFGEGGIERSTTVRYSCGSHLDMSVREDSTCHYIVDISVPALCHHPLFKAPVSKKQVVKCLPLDY